MAVEFPDVAQTQLPNSGEAMTLQRVGMANIEVPVLLNPGPTPVHAVASVYVSLDAARAKGIHMSRLYLILQAQLSKNVLESQRLQQILQELLASHKDISQSAHLELRFELPSHRPSLLSGNQGYRRYPVYFQASLDAQGFHLCMGFEVLYSSTCPCSAALSRQVIQEGFREQFNGRDQVDIEEVLQWLGREESISATPHGQRSVAEVSIIPDQPLQAPSFIDLIDQVEHALQTPVQSAVKRADEQEFARLNARNLMFAEDAARRIGHCLNQVKGVKDFRAKVSHIESLHPHDAVAIVSKGLKNSRLPVGW